MNHRYSIFILFFILFLCQFQGFSQQAKEFDLLKDNIEYLLPPLETIIDSAVARNPNLKSRDLQVVINEHNLKATQMDWTRNIGVQTDVRYGTFDNFASNVVEGQNPALSSTRNTQTNYGVGGYIRMPIYDFLNRKNQVKLSKAQVEQAQSLLQVQRSELRQQVIRQYNEVIVKQRLLKIKSRYAETARINMEMVERQFLSGVVTIAEYSSITEIVSRSEADLESSKMDFRTSFMLLEEIVGIKFNLINKLK